MMKEKINVKNSTIIQSMGGKARGKIQQDEARKRIDEYNANPNLCLNCGEPIFAPYDKKLRETKIKKFCCKSCSAQYSNKRRESIAGWTGESRIDLISNEILLDAFNKSSSIIEFANNIGYTKNALYNKHVTHRLNELGIYLEDLSARNDFENMTKGELFDSCKNWQSARSAIAKFARSKYNNSNKPKCCVICGYNHYEVAHIKPVSSFPDEALMKDISSIENLTALCPNHHYEYDNGILSSEDLIKALSIYEKNADSSE